MRENIPPAGTLLDSQLQLTSLLDTLPDAVIFLNEKATIQYANTSAASMLEASPHELPGKDLWQCASHLITTSLYSAVMTVVHTRKPLEVEYRSPVTRSRQRVYLSPTNDGVALFFREDTCPTRNMAERKHEEEELRVLVDAIPQFVWIAGPDGYITYNNQRLTDYLAMTLEQAKGHGWMAGVHPDDQQRVWDAWQTSIQTGVPYEVEHRLQDGTSGAYRWFLVRGVPRRNAQGTIYSWIGTATDIDEQKQAAERVKANEQNWRVLAEMVPQLVWTTWPDGRLDYANQQYCDVTQTDIEHLRDWGWRQFVHPEDLERTLALRQHSLETGELYENEYRLQDGRTGAYRWFLARALPMRDEAGQITKWFGTGTYIDEQKRTEEALRQSQEKMRTLMDSSIIGIAITEGEEVVDANDTYLRMTGYSREDLSHRRMNWVRMTPPEYMARTLQAHSELTIHHYITPYEKEYICKDGSRLPILAGGVILPLDPAQNIFFVLDNSARKELEQRKDDFISMAGHELRTPLTMLKMQAQLARRRLVKQGHHEAAADLSEVETPIKQLERLIGELLDVSKIQAGRLEYGQEPVDLEALLCEVAEAMQQMSTTHTVVVHGAAPHTLIGDKGRLEQVFINLISNAMKYSPAATTVEIDLSASPETVTASVRDSGIGIPQDQYEKIFERFYRVPHLSQGAVSGLGMGLYIVAEIVRHHGGTVRIESDIGRGSTFHVTLPLKGPSPCRAIQRKGHRH